MLSSMIFSHAIKYICEVYRVNVNEKCYPRMRLNRSARVLIKNPSWSRPSKKNVNWDGFDIGERFKIHFYLVLLYLLYIRPSCPSKKK